MRIMFLGLAKNLNNCDTSHYSDQASKTTGSNYFKSGKVYVSTWIKKNSCQLIHIQVNGW